MEAPAELLAALPALATALALLLAWLLVRRGPAASPEPAAPAPAPAPALASGNPAPTGPCAPEPAAAPEGPAEPAGPPQAEAEEQATEARQEEEPALATGQGAPHAGPAGPAGPADEEGAEGFSFRYSPGKLRGSQYQQMLSREELEEEQRVQREQLAAIFKLMEDNKETFGEMSDGDVREQLRLYDM